MEKKRINTVVVDDNLADCESLAALLQQMNTVELSGTAFSVDEAIPLIIRNQPDMILLNIEMPKKDGFELVTELKRLELQPHIVFVTSNPNYAIQALRCAAFDYLMKPVNPEELTLVIHKALSFKLNHSVPKKLDHLIHCFDKQKKLRFNSRSGFIFLDPTDIIYAEADWNYTQLHLKGQKTEMLTLNLGAVEKLLPPGRFHRINRSILINLDYLTNVNSKEKRCFLNCTGFEKEFKIPVRRIRDLESHFFQKSI